MSGNNDRCVTCGRGAPYRFCSNVCFKAYSKKRIGVDCAVCRYRGEKEAPGGLSSNRICPECREDPANNGWRRAPRHERNGFDPDFFEAAAVGFDVVERKPFHSEKCLRIVKLIAGGLPYAEIATLCETTDGYIRKVAHYWNKETNNLLRRIRYCAKC